ncbi:xanthine dehydrogenase family protein molybdopterin-binding subunit [Wenxinia saemankumensis]|uniref:Isoquinoline 1-oxidoreductase, beta subunit n=1 Tax=Wenxinia saemankumensis TaxID=1447782 RepID=A0A1M6G8D6_9RHOB|nr:molybdopterin cofactor-binding domain-containing protein [Wenxinia saemankumensis]SHJ06191.1 isoquinoline 1-oxidoreductase, beta subunit [Wenxinia saemankumensis]
MGRLRTISRRTFLVGLTAVSGGVAFGVMAARSDYDNPLTAGLGAGEAAITPYVRIDAEGVTLITPRTDLGQGGYHVQAALLAEELMVDPASVRIDPGQPAPAYYNTGFADEAVPFRPTDYGWAAEASREAMAGMLKIIAMQLTGGSTTVKDAYEKLRIAGATARETLIDAASQVSGVERESLRAEDGAIVLPDGTRLTYAGLAPVAATLTPPRSVALKPPTEFRLLGKAQQRLDIVPKSTGRQVFSTDVTLPDMLFAAVALAPNRGEVTGIDAAAAEAMPGVLSVHPVTGGAGVLASTTWHAMEAARAIRLETGPSPYPPEQEAHWAVLAEAIRDDNRNQRKRDDGDAGAALPASSRPVSEFRAPYLAHQPLEPLSATVRIAGGRADLWCASQVPGAAVDVVADVAGLPAEAVTIHVQYAGGSFGQHLEILHIRAAAELAAQAGGRPVKLTFSRETDFQQDFVRQIALARGTGAVADGHVTAIDLDIAAPSVMGSQATRTGGAQPPGADLMLTIGAWDAPYELRDFRVSGYIAQGLAPVSSWRSVGASTNVWFIEALMAELIHEAGADPVEERLRLIRDPFSRGVIEAAAEAANWGSTPEGRGRGIAFGHSFGVPVAEIVEVSRSDRGIRIEEVWCATEAGRVLDPINYENQAQGGVIWGLAHAMNCETTYAGGVAQQVNYDAYPGLRLYNAPRVNIIPRETSPGIHGIGEPTVPPAAPALAAAIFDLTGERLREMPFSRHVSFA